VGFETGRSAHYEGPTWEPLRLLLAGHGSGSG
jgi:hypothetical protein